MFTRNPNDPAQITIRLANERVVLEAPSLRDPLAQLSEYLGEAYETLNDVREKTNGGEDYRKVRGEIIQEFCTRLRPTLKTSGGFKKLAKRASVYVREPLVHVDAALHQMLVTVESLKETKLADFRAQLELVFRSLEGVRAGFEAVISTAQSEKYRAFWSVDTVCLPLIGLILCGAVFMFAMLGVEGIERHLGVGQVSTTFLVSGIMLAGAIACFWGAARSLVRYYRATAVTWLPTEAECEATA